MSESTIKLLNLINEGKTVNEISEIMGLSNKAIYGRLNMLRNAGYNFKRIYYSDGNIVYSNGSDMAWYNEKQNGFNLIPKDNKFEAIVISDLHFGSVHEIDNIMNIVYDYCVKNNIHIILFGGDLLDGDFGFKKKITDIDEQIDYLMRKYPFDKSILNFGVLGDHDYSIYKSNSRDLSLLLNNYRHDIVPLGYYIGKLNIGYDQLIFLHGTKNKYLANKLELMPDSDAFSNSIILRGHSHNFLKVIEGAGNIYINLPPASRVGIPSPTPSIIKIRISFNNGIFSNLCLNQLLIGKKINMINELNIDVLSKKKNSYCSLIGNSNYNCNSSDGTVTEICEGNEFDKTKTLVKEL